MSNAIKIAAHLLGLIGMAGVFLLPARAWSLGVKRDIGVPLQKSIPHTAVAAAVAVAILFSAYVGVNDLPRVFKCLWEAQCTATRGGALLNLALFGFTIVVVEIFWALSRAYLVRKLRDQPKPSLQLTASPPLNSKR